MNESTQSFEYDIFLSFSSRNETEAKFLWKKLSSCGLKVFWSDVSLKQNVGESFFAVIEKALMSSRHFVLLWTTETIQSKWAKLEYESFFSHYHLLSPQTRRFIIFQGKNFHSSEIPLFLKNIQCTQSINEIISIAGGLNVHSLQNEIKTVVEGSKIKNNIFRLTLSIIILSGSILLIAQITNINNYIIEIFETSQIKEEDITSQKNSTDNYAIPDFNKKNSSISPNYKDRTEETTLEERLQKFFNSKIKSYNVHEKTNQVTFMNLNGQKKTFSIANNYYPTFSNSGRLTCRIIIKTKKGKTVFFIFGNVNDGSVKVLRGQ